MKRRTYRIVSHIPIVGAVIKAMNMPPLQLYGSFERESGFAAECEELVKEYLKTNPDEQITYQLVNRLLKEKRRKEANK